MRVSHEHSRGQSVSHGVEAYVVASDQLLQLGAQELVQLTCGQCCPQDPQPQDRPWPPSDGLGDQRRDGDLPPVVGEQRTAPLPSP